MMPPVIRYSLLSLAFSIPAVWVLTLSGCLLWTDVAVCGSPYLYPLTALGVIALTLAPLGLTYAERARRKASRGMWHKVSTGTRFEQLAAVWQDAGRIAWGESESEAITGEMRFERRRWLIDAPNGQRVYVDRQYFWRWLQAVDRLQRELPPGQSALSMRRWKGRVFEGTRLAEGDVLAFREILKAVGAVDYRTNDARSMYYVPGAGYVWGRVEEFEKTQKSEVY